VFLLRGQCCEHVLDSGGSPGWVDINTLGVNDFPPVTIEDVGGSQVGPTLFVLARVVHVDFTAADVGARQVSEG
jgi:hypothetical protein